MLSTPTITKLSKKLIPRHRTFRPHTPPAIPRCHRLWVATLHATELPGTAPRSRSITIPQPPCYRATPITTTTLFSWINGWGTLLFTNKPGRSIRIWGAACRRRLQDAVQCRRNWDLEGSGPKSNSSASIATGSLRRATICWYTRGHTLTRGPILVIFAGRRSGDRIIWETIGR